MVTPFEFYMVNPQPEEAKIDINKMHTKDGSSFALLTVLQHTQDILIPWLRLDIPE